MPIVHTCLFPYFCRYRFVLAVLWVDDGSYWSTMVSGGLDLILQCWSAGTNCARVSGRGLLRQDRARRAPPEMDDLHFIISSMFFGLEFTDKLECMGR